MTDTAAETDRYLTGVYAPVTDELVATGLEIVGEIPAGLVGTYARNGANPAFTPRGRYHIFDGDGMIHAVTFDEDGSATYRNRWVESKGLLAERRAGRALFGGLSEFALPPPELQAEAGLFKNTANTNVIHHGDRLLALMEAALPTELTPELATVGEYDFDGALVGPMTAHPKIDPVTGELVFFGYSPFPPYLRFHVADRSGRLVRSVEVDAGRATMMHDFVVTERYAVFFDLPALFDIEAMMAGGPGVRWDAAAGARIGVLPRDATDATGLRWIEIEPCYVFHFLNAFDTPEGLIEVTGCRSPQLNTSFGDEPPPPEGTIPTLHRWQIDPSAGTVSMEQLDDRAADFPRVSPASETRPFRYGYLGHTASWTNDDVVMDGVTKWDLGTGTESTHVYGSTHRAGEAVFAPDPEGRDEDAGWLLNFVTDMTTGTTSLVVLDASDMAAPPVAEVRLPRRVPFGFHGNWMPGLIP